MAARRKEMTGGHEIARKFIGGHEIRAQYCGDVLFWEKGEDSSGYLGIYRFRYRDHVYFSSPTFICDVDFGDGTIQTDETVFYHRSQGEHVCTVKIKKDIWGYPDDPYRERGPVVIFDVVYDDDGNRIPGGITETMTDVPEVIDSDGRNLNSITAAFINSDLLKTIHDTIFQNLTSCEGFIGTFHGAVGLERISEKVYSYFKGPVVYERYDFSDHYAGCISLCDAPRLYEMFPDAIGLNCYDGCSKLPYFSDIPFPWRMDITPEEVLDIVFPPTDGYEYPLSNKEITITAFVKAGSYRFSDEATVYFYLGGRNTSSQSKTIDILGAENGQISCTFTTPKVGVYEVRVIIDAVKEYDKYTPQKERIGISREIKIV